MSRPDHIPCEGPTRESSIGSGGTSTGVHRHVKSILQPTILSDLPLSAEAIDFFEMLEPFQDCMLVLDDARIPCHRVKLAEASTVLR